MPAQITVSFTNCVTMHEDDHIQVHLEGFTGATVGQLEGNIVTQSPAPSVVWKWHTSDPLDQTRWDTLDKHLKLVLNGDVRANTQISVTVDASVGISLPLASFATDQPQMTIALVRSSLPNILEPIQSSVGTGLVRTSLAWMPPVGTATSAIDITLSFTSSAGLR